ncbi:hypothetical protein NQ317_007757 [Molorchus minor]|uniref:Catalase n=1 Tax=Molorchus minor TaxID=1323400 RepID=A0ABQ9JDD2_9CUCU|nr:hypothetical protein NQ317_007757 [Molorchus minor]
MKQAIGQDPLTPGNRQVEKFFKDDANPTLRHTGDFLLFQGNCPVEKFFKDDIEQRV